GAVKAVACASYCRTAARCDRLVDAAAAARPRISASRSDHWEQRAAIHANRFLGSAVRGLRSLQRLIGYFNPLFQLIEPRIGVNGPPDLIAGDLPRIRWFPVL